MKLIIGFLVGFVIIFLVVWNNAGVPEKGYERLNWFSIWFITLLLWGCSLVLYGVYNQFRD